MCCSIDICHNRQTDFTQQPLFCPFMHEITRLSYSVSYPITHQDAQTSTGLHQPVCIMMPCTHMLMLSDSDPRKNVFKSSLGQIKHQHFYY